jgi:hypothetical protein
MYTVPQRRDAALAEDDQLYRCGHFHDPFPGCYEKDAFVWQEISYDFQVTNRKEGTD